MSNDIVTILRDISNEPRTDEDLAQACLDGAREIDGLRGDLRAARGQRDAALAKVERLQHRVRFADAVIRSGAVAALTEAEMAAVETAVCEAEAHQHAVRAATLRGLLERLK